MVLESLQQHAPHVPLSPPQGIPVTEPTCCAACGCDLLVGDHMVWSRPGKGFTDWQYLTHPTLRDGQFPLCTSCAVFFTSDYLRFQAAIPAAVYGPAGAWSLTGDAERRWFLLTPPEPPFVAYIATTMGQHVVWRSPITMDAELLRIGIARTVLTIHRHKLLVASDLCHDLAGRMREDGLKVTGNHPFTALDRKMEAGGHGQIRPDFLMWMQNHGLTDEINLLESLGEGEIWGLAILNKSKPDIPAVTTIADKLITRQAKKEEAQ
jgi:CRISPR type IV-associated protein Csf1